MVQFPRAAQRVTDKQLDKLWESVWYRKHSDSVRPLRSHLLRDVLHNVCMNEEEGKSVYKANGSLRGKELGLQCPGLPVEAGLLIAQWKLGGPT